MPQIKDFYNSTAHRYDLRQGNPWTEHLRRAEERLVKRFAHGRIIDVGCGTGHHLAFMERDKIGSELVGIDISEGMLKQAKKRCGCELVEAPAEDLPFPDNSFDTLICFHGTFNFLDHKKAIREMERVLKRNGVLLLSINSIWDKDYPPFRRKLRSPKENAFKSLRLEDRKLRIELFSKNTLLKAFENAFRPIYFKGLFVYQRPYWGRFDITTWQKMKLRLDRIVLSNKAGCVYLVAFKKQ